MNSERRSMRIDRGTVPQRRPKGAAAELEREAKRERNRRVAMYAAAVRHGVILFDGGDTGGHGGRIQPQNGEDR